MKVILNKCFGGFGFSREATVAIAKAKGVEVFAYQDDFDYKTALKDRIFRRVDEPKGLFVHYSTLDKPTLTNKEIIDSYFRVEDLSDDIRTDADAIRIVEEMGKRSWGSHAELQIIEIPDGVQYEVDDYDGVETIHEQHRSWG